MIHPAQIFHATLYMSSLHDRSRTRKSFMLQLTCLLIVYDTHIVHHAQVLQKGTMFIWVNHKGLTATSLEMMNSRGDYPQMAD